MRLTVDQRLPLEPQNLVPRLTDLLTKIARQVNGVSEGSISAQHGAMSAAPTLGKWTNGDVVRNASPTLLTDDPTNYPAGYVVWGWMCIAAGEPGTWCQLRFPYFAA